MASAATWALGLTFWCSVFFIAAVSTFWRWWRSPLGRAFITFDAFMTITIGPSACDLMFGWPDETRRVWQWEAISGFFVVSAAMLWKTWVLFRVQAGPEDHILSNKQAMALLTAHLRRLRRGSGTG